MTKHKSWLEETNERLRADPESEFAVAYKRAERELDAKWKIECRWGSCVIFVSPDSSVGPDQSDGWGPIDCPCKANEEDGYDLAEWACPHDGTKLVAPWQRCPTCGRSD